METLDQAIQALHAEPSGVLVLSGPTGLTVGALISPQVLHEMRELVVRQHVQAAVKKRSTRKERKQRAAARRRAEEAQHRLRGW